MCSAPDYARSPGPSTTRYWKRSQEAETARAASGQQPLHRGAALPHANPAYPNSTLRVGPQVQSWTRRRERPTRGAGGRGLDASALCSDSTGPSFTRRRTERLGGVRAVRFEMTATAESNAGACLHPPPQFIGSGRPAAALQLHAAPVAASGAEAEKRATLAATCKAPTGRCARYVADDGPQHTGRRY